MTSYKRPSGEAVFPSHLAHLIDFSPRATRGGRGGGAAAPEALLIRSASADDAPAVARLEALNERELPSGERLIALLAGRPVAAVEVDSGFTVADPFVPTSAIVELLGLRAAQVRR
jgi:hypothetical protein